MSLKLSFSWIGIVVFALPMLINIIYAIFPPVGDAVSSKKVMRPAEIIENVSRAAYLVLLTVLASKNSLKMQSVWLMAAALFLVLYYIVWIRYFAGGRDVALLKKSFLFVPIPLAVFPVLYFLCAAVWLGNLPAAISAVIFGAAHITVSVQSFR